MGRRGKIRAVVFDLDDTLVESTVDFAKFKTLVIERMVSRGEPVGKYRPEETIVAILDRYECSLNEMGASERTIKERLRELDEIMDAVEMEHVHETRPISGAADLLRTLRERGIRIGILTRGCEAYARKALRIGGMDALVDEVESRNSDTRAKPHPDAYLKLVSRLGVDREETIFVGDHPIDAQCARNAGVMFVAVRTGDVPDGDLEAAGSAAVFQDVGHMVEWFEKLLED
ncbi:MAG: HAD family hydrolase [Thermoplasmata archaeon]|nr:HAD family hydrolase [Thermoplasmata archaeon]